MSASYLVNARTDQSAMTVGAADAADALRRAREMTGSSSTVTITDNDGVTYSVEEFEALLSGLTAAERGEPAGDQAALNP